MVEGEVSTGLQKCLEDVRAIIEEVQTRDPLQVVRIFAPMLSMMLLGEDLRIPEATRSLLVTVLRLKVLCQETQSLLTVSCLPSSVPRRFLHQLATIADTHIRIESFAGASDSVPYEFKAFSGLLAVIRVQSIGALAPFRPQNQRYGLKRDRRKLHIEPLHLPPEESRAVGPGSGAVAENSASISCSTMGAGDKIISVDF